MTPPLHEDRHADDDPIEHDPTGMRALLGSIPDPGPMPEDVEARIRATLRLEQQQRTAATGRGGPGTAPAFADIPEQDATPPPPPPAPVHELPARPETGEPGRSGQVPEQVPEQVPGQVPGPAGRPAARPPTLPSAHRSGRHRLALAAAGIAIALAGGGVLVATQGGPGSVVASMRGESADSAGSAASGPVAAAPQRNGTGSAGLALAPGAVQIQVSETAYTSKRFSTQVRRTLSTPDPSLPPLSAESQGIGPLATPMGARACTGALGIPQSDAVLVDLGTVDGTPAAVVVHQASDGALQAYAVQRTCTTGHPGKILGPIDVP